MFHPPSGRDQKNEVCHQEREELCLPPLAEAIRMEPCTEEEIDPVPRHPDDRRPEHGAASEAEVADPAGIAAVKDHQVGQQRHQRPHLLWIPSPESPPGDVGPQAAEDRAGREEDHRHLHRFVDVAGQFGTGLGGAGTAAGPLRIAAEEVVAQRQDPQAPGEGAGGVTGDDREDVDREPEVIAKDRLERAELLPGDREEPGDEGPRERHSGDDEPK